MATISQAAVIVTAMVKKNLELAESGKARFAETVIPYLQGLPGIGKTSIIYQVAESLGMDVFVVRLSEYEPSEMAGWNIPNEDNTQMVRIVPNWIPTTGRPTIIFFDEMPQGHVMCQNVAAQAMNERRVGPHPIPDNCIIVAAGNGHKDRAGTNRMPTHLADRLTFIDVEPVVEDTTDYFMDNGIDSRICAYLRFRPDMLSQFDRDAQACPSPRSWERVNTLMECEMPSAEKMMAIRGQIGESAALDFGDYLKLVQAVPDIDALIANPTDEKKAPVDFKGKEAGILYAIAAALVPRVDAKRAPNIIKYLRRMPRQEIAAYVVADALRKDRELSKVPEVREWLLKEGRSFIKAD